MNCEIIKDLIPLYIDGCCSKESERAVEEHLSVCSECKKGKHPNPDDTKEKNLSQFLEMEPSPKALS